MISPKADAKNPCSTCEHNAGHRWCKMYVDDITGSEALLSQARPMCNGDNWEKKIIAQILDGDIPGSVVYHDDRIETPKATIHRDVPPKVYE